MGLETTKIRQDLRTFIVDSFLIGDEDAQFTDADSFMRKGIIDSTGILELTGYVERTFGFSIEDNEMIPSNLDSIDNLVKFISSKAS